MQRWKKIIFLSALTIWACTMHVSASNQAQPLGRPTMVVFVHGTILPYIKLGVLQNLFRDLPSRVTYEHTVADVMRYQGWYQYQPIADYGLRPLHDAEGLHDEVYTRNQLYGAMFDKIWQHAFGTKISAQYAFGWDGSLSAPRRLLAAQAFYQSLLRERNVVAVAHNCPSELVDIVLITHSHGGSLGLLLAEQETRHCAGLSIEHLVLLGTPIQQETEHLVHHQLFRNIWSLYSRGDVVQVLDMITTKGTSKRLFSPEHQPAKLKQCALELIDEAGTLHLPSHVQLWFYDVQNFQPFFLQAYSPVNPLPIAVFTPLILKLLMANAENVATVRMSKTNGLIMVNLHASSQPQQSVTLPHALVQPYEKHFRIS